MTLKEEFEVIVQKYVDAFCEKQECDFDGWVGNDAGTIGCFNDAYLVFDNIRYDIDTSQLKGKIFDWYWDILMQSKSINYESYCMGVR